MIKLIIFFVSFLSSIIGAICGIGGGVIIKPVLDSFGVLSVSTVSFLSGCTVLSMSTYSVIKGFVNKEKYNWHIIVPLAIGGAIGGVAGRTIFKNISLIFENANTIGAIQASMLMIITIFTLIYTIIKSRIKEKKYNNPIISVVIGLLLGIMSSFLGIGGGPINLVVLYYFFSMKTKEAVNGSLFIIFFSQLTNVFISIVDGIPSIEPIYLIGMVSMGILGGNVGKRINRIIDEKIVSYLFMILMVIIILISCYNIFKYI